MKIKKAERIRIPCYHKPPYRGCRCVEEALALAKRTHETVMLTALAGSLDVPPDASLAYLKAQRRSKTA